MPTGPIDPTFTMPFAPGERVGGRYQIDELIGTGGIGFIASAIHVELGERVAIKFLRPEYWNHAEALRRFASEARLAARVRSDFVVRVFDVGTLDNGVPYMVMELLKGRDLAQLLAERGPFDVGMAVSYALQACAGLAAAHASLVVHRDVKPDNLYLAQVGFGGEVIKLVDFGIGKREQDAESAARTMMAVGSPTYMSPEQIRAEENIDLRTDVWSLGCVLYEILSGRRAFEAPSLMQVCAAVLEASPPPLRSLNPAVPVELERIIQRCLEKAPGARFQDTAALALALMPFAPEHVRHLALHCSEIWENARRQAAPQAAASLAPKVSMPAGSATPIRTAPPAPATIPSVASTSKYVPASTLAPATRAGAVPVTAPAPPESTSTDEESPFASRGRGKAARWGIGIALLLTALGVGASWLVESKTAATAAPAASALAPAKQATGAQEPAGAAFPSPNHQTSDSPSSAELQQPHDAPAAAASVSVPLVHLPQTATAVSRSEHNANSKSAEHAVQPAVALPADDASALAPASVPATTVQPSPAALEHVKTQERSAAEVPTAKAEASSLVAPKPATTAALTGPVIATVVRSHAGEVRACYERAQMDQANLSGRVTLSAVLDAGGHVTSSSAVSSFAGGARLAACIAKAARDWKFPAAGGTSNVVSYSFVFD